MAEEDRIESAGDFYGFALQRYRKSLNALIGALIVLTLGVVGVGVWLVFSLDKIETVDAFQEERMDRIEHEVHEGRHGVEGVKEALSKLPDPSDFPSPTGELRKRVNCVDQNVRDLREGLRQLLVDGISVDEFFATSEFRTCP
jgi:hypothetical protein